MINPAKHEVMKSMASPDELPPAALEIYEKISTMQGKATGRWEVGDDVIALCVFLGMQADKDEERRLEKGRQLAEGRRKAKERRQKEAAQADES